MMFCDQVATYRYGKPVPWRTSHMWGTITLGRGLPGVRDPEYRVHNMGQYARVHALIESSLRQPTESR